MSSNLSLRLFRKRVDPTFEFSPAPPAGPQIAGIIRYCGARLAADARVAFIVLGQIAELVGIHVAPDSFPGPVREGIHLPKRLAAGQTMLFQYLEILSRRRLFTAQSGKPDVVGFQSLHQRSDLTELAALGGIGLVETAPWL